MDLAYYAGSIQEKQGCALAPVLFSLFFTCMLSGAVQGLREAVYIR